MKHIAALLVTLVLVGPAGAQSDADTGDMEEGLDLLSEGTRLLLRGLMNELEPAIRGLQEGLQDLDAYHPPEILPNGDIIIRRKRPTETAPGDEIEI